MSKSRKLLKDTEKRKWGVKNGHLIHSWVILCSHTTSKPKWLLILFKNTAVTHVTFWQLDLSPEGMNKTSLCGKGALSTAKILTFFKHCSIFLFHQVPLKASKSVEGRVWWLETSSGPADRAKIKPKISSRLESFKDSKELDCKWHPRSRAGFAPGQEGKTRVFFVFVFRVGDNLEEA